MHAQSRRLESRNPLWPSNVPAGDNWGEKDVFVKYMKNHAAQIGSVRLIDGDDFIAITKTLLDRVYGRNTRRIKDLSSRKCRNRRLNEFRKLI